tara:strand:- start:854 stop:1045 length:192 start_codon:yes stop_codon:yes gene_type:complete
MENKFLISLTISKLLKAEFEQLKSLLISDLSVHEKDRSEARKRILYFMIDFKIFRQEFYKFIL